jgi:uracil-DNA glycosylase family 4
VARAPRASFAGEPYWARPLPGFGDPCARLLVVGLAPAAHGGNRTGRMFTGDRSGDFLMAALHRAGFANQPTSTAADDGLELWDTYVTAPVRCAPPANRPEPDERSRCAPYLAEELGLLADVRVVLALGAFALDSLWSQPAIHERGARAGRERKPRFSHGAEAQLAPLRPGGTPRTLVCSYHPSQRNVFTGLLTPEMLDDLLARIRTLLG